MWGGLLVGEISEEELIEFLELHVPRMLLEEWEGGYGYNEGGGLYGHDSS